MAEKPKDDGGSESNPTGGASFEDVVKTFLRKKPQPHKRKKDERPEGEPSDHSDQEK
jgi:hypothetical protein